MVSAVPVSVYLSPCVDRWFLQAMELYSRIEGRDQPIAEMAPSEVRALLYNVLSLDSSSSSIR